jgi:hypothetical protein
MNRMPPKVTDAPGIIWRPNRQGWEARWQCRTDLINAGFSPKSQRLWIGAEPTEKDVAYIQDSCRRLQDEMLVFSRGGLPDGKPFDGTLRALTSCYQTDPDSTYAKKRFSVRKNHDAMLKRMMSRHGDEHLSDIKGRLLLAWHKDWSHEGQKLAIGHMFIGLLRTLFGFGATILEDPECERLCAVLHKMRFQAPKPRTEVLTADMAQAVIMKSHEFGWHSIALAQAFQFDLMLRQKDVIGEWVPLNEPGVSEIIYSTKGKWITGLQWSSVNDNLILKHTTSKRQKGIEVDLKLAPMVMEVLAFLGGRKTTGPVIICEATGNIGASGGSLLMPPGSPRTSEIWTAGPVRSPRPASPAPSWSISNTPPRTATSA